MVLYLVAFVLIVYLIYVAGNYAAKTIRKNIKAKLDTFWKITIPDCISQLKNVAQNEHLPTEMNGLIAIVVKELQIALAGKYLSHFSGTPNPHQNILEEIKSLLLKIQSELPDSTIWSQNTLKGNLNNVSIGINSLKKLQEIYNRIRIFDTPDPIDLFK